MKKSNFKRIASMLILSLFFISIFSPLNQKIFGGSFANIFSLTAYAGEVANPDVTGFEIQTPILQNPPDETDDLDGYVFYYTYTQPIDYNNVNLAWHIYKGFDISTNLNNDCIKLTENSIDGSKVTTSAKDDWSYYHVGKDATPDGKPLNRLTLKLQSQSLKPDTTYVITFKQGFLYNNNTFFKTTSVCTFTTTQNTEYEPPTTTQPITTTTKPTTTKPTTTKPTTTAKLLATTEQNSSNTLTGGTGSGSGENDNGTNNGNITGAGVSGGNVKITAHVVPAATNINKNMGAEIVVTNLSGFKEIKNLNAVENDEVGDSLQGSSGESGSGSSDNSAIYAGLSSAGFLAIGIFIGLRKFFSGV